MIIVIQKTSEIVLNKKASGRTGIVIYIESGNKQEVKT